MIQYGLVSLRRMATIATVFYLAAASIGLVLLATRGSPALLVIGVVGFIVSLGYTAPPLKFVYRGLGEIAVAVGFGPLMLLGAYVVQTGGALAWEPFVASLPIALLVALILYVNEIPDRRGDARAGKRRCRCGSRGRRSFAATRRGRGRLRDRRRRRVAGLLPVPALLVLLTIPLALQVAARPHAQLRQPVRADGDHGRQHPRASLRRAFCCSPRTSSCSWPRRSPRRSTCS